MLTTDEIIRAMGCCIEDPEGERRCGECPYHKGEWPMQNGTPCLNRLKNDALRTMITQQISIEALQKMLFDKNKV